MITEFGKNYYLSDLPTPDYLRSMSPVKRISLLSSVDLEDLEKEIGNIKDSDSRARFVLHLERWFNRLKKYMAEFRISQEDLAQYGLDWKYCKNFYYSHRV